MTTDEIVKHNVQRMMGTAAGDMRSVGSIEAMGGMTLLERGGACLACFYYNEDGAIQYFEDYATTPPEMSQTCHSGIFVIDTDFVHRPHGNPFARITKLLLDVDAPEKIREVLRCTIFEYDRELNPLFGYDPEC